MKYLQGLDFDFIEMLNFAERPFKAKFIPSKVWNDLDEYKNDSVGLRNYFKKWKFKVQYKHDEKVKKYLPVGGWHEPSTGTSQVDIYTKNFNKFNFDDKSWVRFKFKLIQVAMHELIHCKQYMGKHEDYSASKVKFHKTGKSKIDENRHYHSGRDEIEAYAHCIYLDYKMYKPTMEITTLIRRCKTVSDSSTMYGILKVFGKDHRNNHALPLLMRKILTWERKYKQYT